MDDPTAVEELRRDIAAVYAERREVANYHEARRASARAARHNAGLAYDAALRRARDAVEQRVTAALRQHAETGVLPPSEQDLVELNELRLESERRALLINALETELRASTERIRAARARAAELRRALAAEAAGAADAERRDAEEASALRGVAQAARARIAAVTDEEAGAVLAVWDAEAAVAARAARAAAAAPLAHATGGIAAAAAEYAAASRRRASDVCDAFALAAADVVRRAVEPALTRLEAQAAAAGAAAPRVAAARARLARLYRDVYAGRDPGDDVSALASAFPLLPLDAEGDWEGGAAPAVGGSGGTGGGAPRSPPPPGDGAAPGSGGDGSGGGGVSPAHPPGGGSGAGDAVGDADAALEARDAAAMGLSSLAAARAEVAALADSAMAAWAGAQDACTADDALELLRAVLRAAALAPRPGMPRRVDADDGGGAPLTDVAAYVREVARGVRE